MQEDTNCFPRAMSKIFTSGDDCKVKAIFLSKRKKDYVYSLNLTIKMSTGGADCKCPAGHGPMVSCKHLVALCFCLEDFVKLRNATLEIREACTSVLQKWNQPRKHRLDSKKAEEISFKCPVPSYAQKAKRRCERKAYDPRPLTMRKTTSDDLGLGCKNYQQHADFFTYYVAQ